MTPGAGGESASSALSGKKVARIEGELILGGIFPVHERGPGGGSGGTGGGDCGPISFGRGIQRMEAMMFAIDDINRSARVLPGVRLGARVLDSCLTDTYALEQALEFVRSSLQRVEETEFVCPDGSYAVQQKRPLPIAGVIGGSDSSVSIQVANLLRLFRIPQVSYASTSATLSDRSRYDLFARTVPPDSHQARAIADLLLHFGWTYVSTVASEGDYGEAALAAFEREARAQQICVAASATAGRGGAGGAPASYEAAVRGLARGAGAAHVAVLFVRAEDARGLLAAAQRLNASFQWVASDGWGALDEVVRGRERAADGAITVELSSWPVQEFDRYFQSLTPANNRRNPWFREFWERRFHCTLPDTRMCGRKSLLKQTKHEQEPKVMFVINAVYAMAHALHNMQRVLCPNTTRLCNAMKAIDGGRLFNDFVLNISFDTPYRSPGSGKVRLDARGEGVVRYNIYAFQRDPPRRHHHRYVRVGHWDEEALRVNATLVAWARHGGAPPASRCSEPCGPGEARSARPPGDACCWSCAPCRPHEYLADEATCRDCGPGRWPSADLSGCRDLPAEHLAWGDAPAAASVCFAVLGIVGTALAGAALARHGRSPAARASDRALCGALLLGVAACYGTTFAFVARPSAAACAARRLGLGTSLAACYAPLLAKTIRAARGVDGGGGGVGARRLRFVSPASRLLLCLALVAGQLASACVWLVVERPGVVRDASPERRERVVLRCNVRDSSMLASLAYDVLLVVLCTLYAYRARRCPENFGEAKYVALTMYTTCVVWLAFLPIFYATASDYRVQTASMCMFVSLSGSVVLCCLFAPKLYVLLREEQRLRREQQQQQ
ncbi:LOW QUALITY PROTEIN: metabotropic glutamate receptor 2-like, partial [Lethenteron reissneri]|uniref:LOW QUALITY PROTEIN: metabotropic glutamate receptor 2-like n=1 Tax=Lethenteron reissneri TaxID=7753 RepID=UPI002AB61CBD